MAPTTERSGSAFFMRPPGSQLHGYQDAVNVSTSDGACTTSTADLSARPPDGQVAVVRKRRLRPPARHHPRGGAPARDEANYSVAPGTPVRLWRGIAWTATTPSLAATPAGVGATHRIGSAT